MLEINSNQYTLDGGSVVAEVDENGVLQIKFTNIYTPTEQSGGDMTLAISKWVRNENTNSRFEFQLFLTDGSGAALAGSYPYTGSYAGSISDGGRFYLADGESITVTGLPEGTGYRVVENNVRGAYDVIVSGDSNIGSLTENRDVTFINIAPGNPGGHEDPPYYPPEDPEPEPSEPPEEPSEEPPEEPSVTPSEPSDEPSPSGPVSEPDPTPEPELAEPTLPQTGQLWWPVPVLLVSGAAAVAFGAFKGRRKSRK